jgi:hypothetical protein
VTPAEASHARSRLLALLATLTLDGLTPDTHDVVRQIPTLHPYLPSGGPNDWAAEHYRFFGREILPWASAFLSPEVHLGGSIAHTVAQCYERTGFHAPGGHEPDHIGIQLMHMAWLCERERTEDAEAFAADHVRSWLLPLSCAGHDAGGFFSEVLELALHLTSSFNDRSSAPMASDIPDVLDDERTGLKQISRWLATPAWAGLLWTHRTLDEISRVCAVAHGFGTRRDVLESTLFAASDAGRLPALTHAMQSVLSRAEGRMTGPDSAPWIDRIHGTARLLERLGHAAQHASTSP